MAERGTDRRAPEEREVQDFPSLSRPPYKTTASSLEAGVAEEGAEEEVRTARPTAYEAAEAEAEPDRRSETEEEAWVVPETAD